ncbi:MAG: exodeoxyribonuclease VII large subunit [Alphaproteobacteria bacterium]|nr:exodeoxyribonuclease VII large subunit [Alphaproteobacteria bacterium]
MLPKPEPLIKPDTIFSVSDASKLLKGVIETAFPSIRVRGELSQIKTASSGHIYASIKDENAIINIIIWRGTPVNFKLEEGLEVIISGKFTLYPNRGAYQLIVSSIEIAGIGAILKMLEERKQKLAAEGVFDESRKKALPQLPQTIGVVTSSTGAAFQDIQNRLKERFPVKIILYPATVQGNTAAKEVVAGIEYFNNMKNVDVIIVARGGGSLEDLLPFSEEIVVRAVANSQIPIISGVGHEPDWMLIDFAADKRAPTPTGAAEIVVPTKISLIQDINNLSYNIMNTISNLKNNFANMTIKSPNQILLDYEQKLDDFDERLFYKLKMKLNNIRQLIDNISRVDNVLLPSMNLRKQNIKNISQVLSSLSYKNVLQRGYAIIRDINGDIISSINTNKSVSQIEFFDGKLKI